jgi:hypothetical protein
VPFAESPKQRLRVARGALLFLALGLLLCGPRIFPCLGCFWNGFEWVRPLPGTFSVSTCGDCKGKGYATGVEWGAVRLGGKPFEDPQFILVDPFGDAQQFKEGSYGDHVRLAVSRSGVNLRFCWPYRPRFDVTTREIFLLLEGGLLLLLAAFGPLFRCPTCSVEPIPGCSLCTGSGTRSAFGRWIPKAWIPRLRKTGKAALIGVPIAFVLFLLAQVPYGECPRCPEITKQNLEAKDNLVGCPRCGGRGSFGLWTRLFLSND